MLDKSIVDELIADLSFEITSRRFMGENKDGSLKYQIRVEEQETFSFFFIDFVVKYDNRSKGDVLAITAISGEFDGVDAPSPIVIGNIED